MKQYRRTTLASKGNKQKSAIWDRGESFSVNIHVEHRGRAFQVEARFLGSIRVRVNGVSGLTYDTCGHPKTDLFENGSFWKRIRVQVALHTVKAKKMETAECPASSQMAVHPGPYTRTAPWFRPRLCFNFVHWRDKELANHPFSTVCFLRTNENS